jgi:hypothetical protein
MTTHPSRPPATDKRLLPAYAVAELARKQQAQCREDEAGRTIARPPPVPIGDPPR